jgi:hypothetical protein
MDITFTIGGTKSKNYIFDDKYDELLGVITAPEIDHKHIIYDENEAFIYWFKNRTLYPKLLGGAEMALSNTSSRIIELIVKDSYAIHTLSKSLRENLIFDNIIGEETTYQEVWSNGRLLSLLYNSIKLYLSDSVKDSKFGGGIVSDFDLIVNLQVTKNFDERMKELKIQEDSETYKKLSTSRGSIRRFVTKIRQSIIIMMDLPETPSAKDLKKKKVKTKDDVKKSIDKNKEILKRSHTSTEESNESRYTEVIVDDEAGKKNYLNKY